MRLVEFLRLTEQEVHRRSSGDGEGNMHDDANQAKWNHLGNFGVTHGGYSFSPEEHPGVLLPDEPEPEDPDDAEDQLVVVKKP